MPEMTEIPEANDTTVERSTRLTSDGFGLPSHARAQALAGKPRYLKTAPSHGLASATDGNPRVVRDGGDFKAGIIRGASLCTRGEALGHGIWCDAPFIASIRDAMAASGDRGCKARFTHPGLSGDGLGTFLGRFRGGSLSADGNQALADLHLSRVSHRSPDGDLGKYVCDLAEEDAGAFAVSICFEHDWPAEEAFLLEHGAVWEQCEEGQYLDLTDFVSPDPDNSGNLPHARLKSLHAADMVDDPAANQGGLFYREQQFAQEADALLAYATGVSDRAPALSSLSVHPDRVKTFLAKFLDQHDLQLTPKEKPMTATTTEGQSQMTEAPETKTETAGEAAAAEGQSQETEAPEAKPETNPETNPAGETAASQGEGQGQEDPRALCREFIAAFGSANGGAWFAEGLSMEQARARHAEHLAAENAALKRRLSAAGIEVGGEETPVTFQPEAEKPGRGPKDAANRTVGSNLTAGLQRFADGISLPEDGKKKRES